MPTCPTRNRCASEKLPRPLLRDKFASLVSQVRAGLAVTPRSFRMGRFDAGPQVLSLLPEFGLEVDSSMVPLTRKNPDPRFFLAPADPFPLGARAGGQAPAGGPPHHGAGGGRDPGVD